MAHLTFVLAQVNQVRSFPIHHGYEKALQDIDWGYLRPLHEEVGNLAARPIRLDHPCGISSSHTYRRTEEDLTWAACYYTWDKVCWELKAKAVRALEHIPTFEVEVSYCLDAPDKIPAGSVIGSDYSFDCLIRPSAISR